MMERFLIAIHDESAPIGRSENIKGIKTVDRAEYVADAFDYFTEKKLELENEFFLEITGRIDSNKAALFCDVIARDWYDGKTLRFAPRVQQLKSSIRNYLLSALGDHSTIAGVVVNWDSCIDHEPLLTVEEVAEILEVNNYLIHSHVEKWLSIHPKYEDLSMDDIFFHRGIDISRPFEGEAKYIEWDYINSYSMAFSAPEKFAQMSRNGTPVLLHGDICLFRSRMLFFSPFIPNMDVGQLEIGMIPSKRPLPLHCQGSHGGILEYILDPRP